MIISVGLILYNNLQSELDRFIFFYQKAASKVRQSGHSVKLYIIENGGRLDLSRVDQSSTIIESKGNIGYTKALNLLRNTAFLDNADVFVTTNPDGCFEPYCLVELVKQHEKFPRDLIEARQFPEEHPKEYDEVTLETKWASGCCVLIPRYLHENVGTHDEEFFMYCEDVDFSWRVYKNNQKVRICPTAVFQHSVMNRPPSTLATNYLLQSGILLGQKWRAPWFTHVLRTELKLTGEKKEISYGGRRMSFLDRFKIKSTFAKGFSFAKVRW